MHNESLFGFIFFYLIFSFGTSVYAYNKGRSVGGFFLLSLFLSPIIAFIALLLMGDSQAELERSKIASGELKRCPDCGELVQARAVVCKHCGAQLMV